MSFVPTVTITLAEYEELKSIKQKHKELKKELRGTFTSEFIPYEGDRVVISKEKIEKVLDMTFFIDKKYPDRHKVHFHWLI